MNAIDPTSVQAWSAAFGLAEAPLFGAKENDASEQHFVMLDGGHGSFALSLIQNAAVDPAVAASWIWSSDIPHHVGINLGRVTVTRWDNPNVSRIFSLSSVRQRIDSFYRYLVQDRVEQNRSVVTHLVEQFRSVRTAVSQAGENDALSLSVFLALLYHLIQSSPRVRTSADFAGASTVHPAIDTTAVEVFERLKDRQLAPLLDRTMRKRLSSVDLSLHSPLAIRHAGGLIFQEAHFELMRTPMPNLFGYLDAPTTKPITRGGAHFTPPALARAVVEQAFAQFDDFAERQELVLTDPACGSGAFLHEALRALRRTEFKGHLHIVARDISGHAITMARFVLSRAIDDWQPKGGTTTSIEVADSLVDDVLPETDIIVMNPPFVAVGGLDEVQKGHIDRILGRLRQGRPDLSMAFVLRALERLKPGGVLGCLFPASLLELQSAAPWRRAIQERASLRFMGLLGDHGLFAYALVQVAAAVLKNIGARSTDNVLTLWTANDKEITSEALRALRSVSTKGQSASEEHDKWRITWLPVRQFSNAASWRLRTPRADRLLMELRNTVPSLVSDIFDVRQGILTGSNEAFIISAEDWSKLTPEQQHFFLPAVMNQSIEDGHLHISSYVFYPYANGKLVIETEDQLASLLPTYYQRTLLPNKEMLERRRAGSQWWTLIRRRVWMDKRAPRVITKYFGAIGAFVPDMEGRVAIVQGYAWYPNPRVAKTLAYLQNASVSSGLVSAYAALLNTRVFSRLLSASAPRVAGGQFNLSRRYVSLVPLPDLAQAAVDGQLSSVCELDALGSNIHLEDKGWCIRADELASQFYGVPLEHWNDEPA